MGDTEKPFTCDVAGCNVSFVSEDRLTSHKTRHGMTLSLSFGNGVGPRNFIEQTPTPTRFINDMEESGLFQELQPGLATPELQTALQTVNPFEADFRRASHGELVVPDESALSHDSSGSLNTPAIPPVTADPILLRGMHTPFSPIVREAIVLPNTATAMDTASVAPAATSDGSELRKPLERDNDAENSQEKLETSSEPTETVGKSVVEKSVVTPVLVHPRVTSLQAEGELQRPGVDMVKAIPSMKLPHCLSVVPVAPSVPATFDGFSPPNSLPPRAVSASLQPVTLAPVALAPIAGTSTSPKTTIIASPTGSVIQIPENVQFVIVSNPSSTSATGPVSVPCVAAQVLQEDTRTKLKETLSTRGRPPNPLKDIPGIALGGNGQTPKGSLLPRDVDWRLGRRKQEDGTEDERKKKNREVNRYAAQRSRAKKKRISEAIEREREEYKRKYEELQAKYKDAMCENAKLREDRTRIRQALKKMEWRHSNCDVTLEEKVKGGSL